MEGDANIKIINRHSIRLPGADYSVPGFFFITICAQNREHIFGCIENGEMKLNDTGKIAFAWWKNLSDYFVNISVDEFIIMPNHMHGIIAINDIAGRGGVPPPSPTMASEQRQGGETPPLPSVRTNPTLGQVVGYYKFQTTKYINVLRHTPGVSVWQRNYYEHIIRHERALQIIRDYIIGNPWNWDGDVGNLPEGFDWKM